MSLWRLATGVARRSKLVYLEEPLKSHLAPAGNARLKTNHWFFSSLFRRHPKYSEVEKIAMTVQMNRPRAKEVLIATTCLVLVLGGAFLAASLTQGTDIFWLVQPPPNNTAANIFRPGQRLDLHRTFFTAWAALLLVTPALCTFLFRRSAELAARYWLAFWTVSFVAFLVHFYWAVFVMFGNDWHRILEARGRVSAPIPDTIVTVWWGLDVLLAWLIKSENVWLRIERALIHLLVFVLFFLGSAKEGERTLSKALGIAMGVAVLISFVFWILRWLKGAKRGDAPAT